METVNKIDEFVVDNMVEVDAQQSTIENNVIVELDSAKKKIEEKVEELLSDIDEILELNNKTILELLNAA